MYLRRFLFTLIIISQCVIPSFQKPDENTILDIFQKDFVSRQCDTVLIDPKIAEYLLQCNISVPDKVFKPENSQGFMCMAYYDVNLKICDKLSLTEARLKLHLPRNKSDIDFIMKSLNGVELADDFCSKKHPSIGKSDFEFTKDYVKIFADAISDQHVCRSTCTDFYGVLKPFCKIILWASTRLSDHNDVTAKYELMNHSIKASAQNAANPPALKTSEEKPTPQKITPLSDTSAPSAPVATGKATNAMDAVNSVEAQKAAYPGEPAKSPSITAADNKATNVDVSKSTSIYSIPVNVSKPPIIGGGLPQRPKVPIPPFKQEQPSEKVEQEEKVDQEEKVESNENVESKEKPSSSLPKLKEIEAGEEEDIDESNQFGEDAKSPDTDNNFDDSDLNIPRGNSASGAAGGASPVENPNIADVGPGYTSNGQFIGAEDSHFFLYFLFASGVLILGYVIFHNKNKVLGLLLEGRRGEGRRRCPGGGPAYRKLDCTLEEAVSSAPPSHTPHIVY